MLDQMRIQEGPYTWEGLLSEKRITEKIVIMRVRLKMPVRASFCFVGTRDFRARVRGIAVTIGWMSC